MGRRNYPIWHEVSACHYDSSKSYGGQSNSADTIYVGSSKKNSHKLGRILVTKREQIDQIIFKLSVDGIVLKEAVFENNNGRAGKLISERNNLDSFKPLK